MGCRRAGSLALEMPFRISIGHTTPLLDAACSAYWLLTDMVAVWSLLS
jgi:hypothetical protein